MSIPVITVGCDPEIFLSKEFEGNREEILAKLRVEFDQSGKDYHEKHSRYGQYRPISNPDWEYYCLTQYKDVGRRPFFSAHGLIPGTKKEPFKVKGGAIQVDGVALEFNIDPANTFDEFNSRIDSVIKQMTEKMNRPELQLEYVPTAHFDKEYWDTVPEASKELGCEPDFNAYSGEPNPKPATEKPFRTASGHIHLGWTSDKDVTDGSHINDCALLAKQLDLTLGLWSVYWDSDEERRNLYGAAGAFRPKPYGMEYRTLSNAWLVSPELRKLVYNNAKLALKLLFKGHYLPGKFPQISEGCSEYSFNQLAGYGEYYQLQSYLKTKYWISPKYA